MPAAVVLIDRQQGGRQTLLDRGYNLYSAFSLSQMLATLAQTGRITVQQRDEVRQTLRI